METSSLESLFPTLPRVGFSKGLVGRCRWPANHDQKHIEDKERNGNVVEERREAYCRQQLIGCPKKKGNSQHDRLYEFHARGPTRTLINDVRERNHGKWK